MLFLAEDFCLCAFKKIMMMIMMCMGFSWLVGIGDDFCLGEKMAHFKGIQKSSSKYHSKTHQ